MSTMHSSTEAADLFPANPSPQVESSLGSTAPAIRMRPVPYVPPSLRSDRAWPTAAALSLSLTTFSGIDGASAIAAEPSWPALDLPSRPVGAARMPWPSPEAFAQEIRAAAHAQPREDGVAHPVDALVARLYEGALADGWLQAAFVHLYHQPAALAELIRGLAWVPQKPRAGIDLTPAGLAHKDASVRESATRLVEHWRDRRLLEPLKQFAEREREPWLCEYMRDVIADLS